MEVISNLHLLRIFIIGLRIAHCNKMSDTPRDDVFFCLKITIHPFKVYMAVPLQIPAQHLASPLYIRTFPYLSPFCLIINSIVLFAFLSILFLYLYDISGVFNYFVILLIISFPECHGYSIAYTYSFPSSSSVFIYAGINSSIK